MTFWSQGWTCWLSADNLCIQVCSWHCSVQLGLLLCSGPDTETSHEILTHTQPSETQSTCSDQWWSGRWEKEDLSESESSKPSTLLEYKVQSLMILDLITFTKVIWMSTISPETNFTDLSSQLPLLTIFNKFLLLLVCSVLPHNRTDPENPGKYFQTSQRIIVTRVYLNHQRNTQWSHVCNCLELV